MPDGLAGAVHPLHSHLLARHDLHAHTSRLTRSTPHTCHLPPPPHSINKRTQLDQLEQVLADWSGPAAVLLNPEFRAEGAEPQHVAFVKAFETIYCFFPLMVKVLFIGTVRGWPSW